MKTQVKTFIVNIFSYILFGLLIGQSFVAKASVQNLPNMGNSDNDSIVSMPYKKPRFPGEDRGLHKYLRENLTYPEIAKQNKIEGRVVCKFIVREDGKIDNITIIKSISPELDEEAIRVIKLMPEWIPAEKENGEKVTSYCMMPIKFILGEDKPPLKEPLTATEKMPSFPGGEKTLMLYLSKNLQYPESALKDGIEGRVVCRFVVKKDGKIDDVKIMRSLSPDCDREVIRLMEHMPEWIPGEKDGEKVAVYFSMPIRFSLEKKDKDDFLKNDFGKSRNGCIGCSR